MNFIHDYCKPNILKCCTDWGGGGIHTSNKFYIFYEENLLILCHLKTL